MVQPRIGGSFAPPLTQEKLDAYKEVCKSAPDQVKDYMGKLIEMVEVFQQTPKSTLAGDPHPSGKGVITPLEKEEIQRIWDYVPWDSEIEAYQKVFDAIPAKDKELRNAAFHLLWFAKELEKDREPITADQIKAK